MSSSSFAAKVRLDYVDFDADIWIGVPGEWSEETWPDHRDWAREVAEIVWAGADPIGGHGPDHLALGLAMLVLVANAGTEGRTGEALRVATADGLSELKLLSPIASATVSWGGVADTLAGRYPTVISLEPSREGAHAVPRRRRSRRWP